MSTDILLVLIILTTALILFVKEWIRVDLVAVLVLIALVLAGLVSPEDALRGFSSPAVITVCAIYVLSAGLFRTGVAGFLGRRILRIAGNSERKLLLAIMLVSAFMSFFMNTVGIVALMLPVLMDIARNSDRTPSKLLMPLAFGALLGGLTTPFATLSNLLVSTSLQGYGLRPFGILDFAPLGSAAALAGIAFLVFAAPRWLPNRDIHKDTNLRSASQLKSQYHLHERMFILKLPRDSILSGKTLSESRLGSALGLHVVAILRGATTLLAPSPTSPLQTGDRLLIQGTPDQLNQLETWRLVELKEDCPEIEFWFSRELSHNEFKIAKGSKFIGLNLALLDFRNRFGANVLAIRRGNVVRRTSLNNWTLKEGDILLVETPKAQIDKLVQQQDLEHLGLCTSQRVLDGYRMEERLFCLEIPSDSKLAGHSLGQSRFGEALGFNVLGILRGDGQRIIPQSEDILQAGDRLIMLGRKDDLKLLRGIRDLELEREVQEDVSVLESETVGIVEAILSPRSNLAGRTLRQLKFRQTYGVNIMGIWRQGTAYTTNLRDMELQYGDALLLYGAKDKLNQLAVSRDFYVLTEALQPPPKKNKAPFALVAMGVFLLPALLGWLAISISAMIGAALMILTGCIRIDQAYAAIDLKSVVLIAGMTPMAAALEHTGAAGMAATHLVGFAGGFGPMAVIAAIFILTSLGTCVLPSAALVLIMAPVAYRTALELGVSPYPVMMALALAAAGSFNSPISHPANIMIMGPGGYRFTDYLKIGIPLTLVVFVVVLLALPFFWPLHG